MDKRLAATVSLMALVTAACGVMSEQQKVGTTRPTTGAVGGAQSGRPDRDGPPERDKSAAGKPEAVGAGAGAAIVGSVGGWAVGDYRLKHVRARDQAMAAAGYTPAQGVVTAIEKAGTSPQQLKPGEQLTFHRQYTVLGPVQAKEIKVTETRTILFENRQLADLPPKDLSLTQGTTEIQESLRLPRDAAAGLYLVMVSLTPAVPNAQKIQIATPFVVRAVTPAASVAPPPATPSTAAATVAVARPPTVETAAVPPTAQAAKVTPQTVYVKIAAANLRDGAGAGFKLLGQVARGTKLQVLGSGGTETDRWFKVKLVNGEEGWVAASVVSSNP